MQLPLVATCSHGAFGADGVVLGGVGGRGLDSDLRQALSGLPRSPPPPPQPRRRRGSGRPARPTGSFPGSASVPRFRTSPLSDSSPAPSPRSCLDPKFATCRLNMIQMRHRPYVPFRLTKLLQTRASRKITTTTFAPSFSVSSLFFSCNDCSRQPFLRVPVRMPDARRAELKRPSEEQCILERAAVSVVGTNGSFGSSFVSESCRRLLATSRPAARRWQSDNYFHG